MNYSDFFKGIDQIYWINLERAKDRYEKMQNMFQNPIFHNIPIERINAFDGLEQDALQFFVLNSGSKMLNIEYACLYSHLNTIKKFTEKQGNDTDIALILEDDMTIEYQSSWDKTIQQIMDNAPKDWEVLQITYIIDKTLPEKVYDEKFLWSAGAYLIRKSAAKKLMNSMVPSIPNGKKYDLTNYDIHQADYLIYTLKTYLYKYPVFIYEFNNVSYLNEDKSLFLARNFSKFMIDSKIYNRFGG
jgi:hypothetical protein